MSNYTKITKHPVTGFWQPAVWLDNYFGPRKYGVRFPDDEVFNPEVVQMETREE